MLLEEYPHLAPVCSFLVLLGVTALIAFVAACVLGAAYDKLIARLTGNRSQ